MSLILFYCEKCGQQNDISDKRLNELKNIACIGCHMSGYLKPIPEEYINEGGWGIIKDLQEQFVEKVIKTSPNFNQECWDRRVAFIEMRKHDNELLKNYKIGQENVPKCPTCSSTNLRKITAASKIMNTAMLGIFGTKRYKSFHCNNCGYEW